jgi:glycosyltransferase involved in cell wall biosynthesis
MTEPKQPLVSILIVTYNAEAFIEATLKSCITQSYSNTEILILDNGSCDATLAKVEAVKKATAVKHVTVYPLKENVGPYAGLNYLLDRAKGDYVAIQDHDDIWLPGKLAQQVAFLEGHKAYSGCGTATYYYFEERSMLICNNRPGDADFVDHTSLLFRNSGVRYLADHSLADAHFEKRILAEQGKLYCLEEPLTVHRIRQDQKNLSASRFKMTKKQMADYTDLHGRGNVADLLNFVLTSRLPKPLLWWIRRHITLRSATWVSVAVFKKQYGNVL